jgi:glutamate/aspartate transport system substrate-binding protein
MRKILTAPLCAALVLAAVTLLPQLAAAQTSESELSPTLQQIKLSRTVRIGFRESSPPFSFLDRAGRPIGYSLELCQAIVDEIAVEVDEPELKVDYVKVTSDTRIDAVTNNQIDLECGSTTANAERAKRVAFSPLMYVAGTKLLVGKKSGIKGIEGMAGKPW